MPEYDQKQVEARLDERMREVDERRESLRHNAEGMRDELADYDQHPADQGTETFEQELDETTLLMLDDEAARVKAARQALADGTYGVCIVCGKDIPAARLEAMPESIRCVEDQSLHEARLRQGGGPAATP
jgi:RNA polymerase-binding transcription factor DksA